MPKYIIVSSDKKEFEITREMLMLSEAFKELAEEESEEDQVITWDIGSEYLAEIVEFLRYQSTPGNDLIFEFEKPLKSKKIEENIKVDWYVKFIEKIYAKGIQYIRQFTLHANFLDIQVLLNLCCIRLALAIKGKTPEEIREVLELPPKKEEVQPEAQTA